MANNTRAISEDDIALRSIENAVSAMVDDMLVCYKSAQLVIAEDMTSQKTRIQRRAITFGKLIFISLLFSLNTLIVAAVLVDVIRTRSWRGLPKFDYLDTRALIMSTWSGAQKREQNIPGGEETLDEMDFMALSGAEGVSVRLRFTGEEELLLLQRRRPGGGEARRHVLHNATP